VHKEYAFVSFLHVLSNRYVGKIHFLGGAHWWATGILLLSIDKIDQELADWTV
jgi:hypothetical protein